MLARTGPRKPDLEGPAVLFSDPRGLLRLCSPTAAELLGRAPSLLIGLPCWQVVGFRTTDGARFCSPNCPVRRASRSGDGPHRHRVLLSLSPQERIRLRLDSFVVPDSAEPRGGSSILHVVEPIEFDERHRRTGSSTAAVTALSLRSLSRREREVLRLLARGMKTTSIADTLCISRNTVRNHIQHILGKLHVHQRVDAILALLEQSPP